MKVEAGDACPFLGGKPCIGLKCKMMTQLRGKHPQTDEPIDEWDCAIKWLPVLLIESTQAAKESGAAVESLRNEIVSAATSRRMERAIENQKALEHAPEPTEERSS